MLSLSLVVVLQEGAAVLAVLLLLLYDEWSNGTPTTIASPINKNVDVKRKKVEL